VLCAAAFLAPRFIAAFFFITIMVFISFMAAGAAIFMAWRFTATFFITVMTIMAAVATAFMAWRFIAAFFLITFMDFMATMDLIACTPLEYLLFGFEEIATDTGQALRKETA
jgi:hypothetical protein